MKRQEFESLIALLVESVKGYELTIMRGLSKLQETSKRYDLRHINFTTYAIRPVRDA